MKIEAYRSVIALRDYELQITKYNSLNSFGFTGLLNPISLVVSVKLEVILNLGSKVIDIPLIFSASFGLST